MRRYAPYYPGLGAWLADINKDGTVDTLDIVTVAEAFGSAPGDPNWDPETDLIEDAVIDISDLILVAENFGKTI